MPITLAEALAVKVGDTLTCAARPCCNLPALPFRIVQVSAGGGPFNYPPSIFGRRINDDGTLAYHHDMWVALDDSEDCRRILKAWSK